MNEPTLIRMANQIADFFQPYSEAEAIEGVQTHLEKFWEPRMRADLIALWRADPAPLKPVVAAAIERLAG